MANEQEQIIDVEEDELMDYLIRVFEVDRVDSKEIPYPLEHKNCPSIHQQKTKTQEITYIQTIVDYFTSRCKRILNPSLQHDIS